MPKTRKKTSPAFTLLVLLALAALGGSAARSADVPVPADDQLVIPLRVSEGMKAWAGRAVPESAPPQRRLRRLLNALVGPSGLRLEEVRSPTYTAIEAFASRQANCAGLAYLYVGLARSLGLEAYFVLVEDVSLTNRRSHLNVREQHMAAAYGPPHEATLFDFAGAQPASQHRWRAISDTGAIAHYYSNRGAEAILAGDPGQAQRWLRTAAELDPDSSAAWANLGVALRRSGHLADAEAAYRRALRADPSAGYIYGNLSGLLTLQGRGEEAARLIAGATAMESRDPFPYWELAEESLRTGRLGEARSYARKALELSKQGGF